MYQYPKINTEAVKSAIIQGMKNGYIKCLMYLGETEEGLSSVREYILTVSVADSLQEDNEVFGQIRVEHPYQKFSDDAFPPCNFKNNNPFDSIYRKCIFHKRDKRKIDIALLSANGERSLCGIEIKAINQPYNKIKSDINRLSKALNRKDAVGESSLQACFVTFIIRTDHRFEYVHIKDVQKSKEENRIKIEQELLSSMRSKYKDLSYTLEYFDVDILTAESEYQRAEDWDDFSHRTRCIMGYIIKIGPNATSTSTISSMI